MIYLVGLALFIVFVDYLPKAVGLHHHNRRNYLILCGFVITAIIGFRTYYTGSPDTRAYAIEYFERIQSHDSFREYYDLFLKKNSFLFSETGFYWTVWLLTRVVGDGHWLILLSTAFYTFSVCRFIHKNSVNPALSLLIYVTLGLMTFNMNGMRQAFAMSICLFSYEFVKERKLIRFFVVILIATLFHKTAIFYLPVYFLPLLKNTSVNWLLFVISLVILMLSLDSLIPWFNEQVEKKYVVGQTATQGGLFVVLIYLSGIGLAILCSDILKKKTASTAMFGVFIGLTAYVSRFFSNEMMERVSYYYFYFLIILIPEAIEALSDEEQKVVKTLFTVLALCLFAYRVYNGEFSNFHLATIFYT